MSSILESLPILMGVATSVFTIFGLLSIREIRKKKDTTKEHFDYSKTEFGNIKEGIGKIYESIETKINPQLESIYKRTSENKSILESETVVKMLSQIGLKSNEISKNSTVIFGAATDTFTASFFITLSEAKRDFTIFSFSKKIPLDNPLVLLNLIRIRTKYDLGMLDISNFGENDVFIFRDVIIPYENVSASLINELITKHMDFHKSFSKMLLDNKVENEDFLFKDFFENVQKLKEKNKEIKAERT